MFDLLLYLTFNITGNIPEGQRKVLIVNINNNPMLVPLRLRGDISIISVSFRPEGEIPRIAQVHELNMGYLPANGAGAR